MASKTGAAVRRHPAARIRGTSPGTLQNPRGLHVHAVLRFEPPSNGSLDEILPGAAVRWGRDPIRGRPLDRTRVTTNPFPRESLMNVFDRERS